MAILNLVSSTDPILYNKVPQFDFSNSPCDPIELSNNLIETMNHYNGMGLSANQCGLPYRVFVMRSDQNAVFFNPRIIDMSSEEISLEEGCLSHPFLYVKIKRSSIIKVRFADHTGTTKTEKFIGITARCFLHEYDHLEGINYLRRANLAHVERAKRQQTKLLRKQK